MRFHRTLCSLHHLEVCTCVPTVPYEFQVPEEAVGYTRLFPIEGVPDIQIEDPQHAVYGDAIVQINVYHERRYR